MHAFAPSPYAELAQETLLGSRGVRPGGLLGFANGQPSGRRSLLGLGADDPRAPDRWNMIGSILQGAGVGLATGDWGAGIAASQAAQNQAQQRKVFNYRMQQDQAQQARDDEEWQHKREEWQQDAEQRQQFKTLLGGISDPQEKAWATMDPKGYLSNKFTPRETKLPASVQEYQFAQQHGFNGDYPAFLQMGHPGTTINMPPLGQEPPDGVLRKKLGEKEAETWNGYTTAADIAGGRSQDLQVLDELMKQAPQGPLTGRLAEMFPGFSSAGDAAQSIVARVAPTMRTPGSGSTSDIEYEGFLKGLPRLRGTPQGNALISQVLQAKNGLEIERGQIVSAYLNNTISAVDARKRLAEINRRSILSPDLRRMIGATSGKAPADLTDEELLNQINGGQ